MLGAFVPANPVWLRRAETGTCGEDTCQCQNDRNCGYVFSREHSSQDRWRNDGGALELDIKERELVYNGKSKETIKISYREYRDDFTRPALYQDLSHDLSESREIAFRDMRIDVLDATNTSIKFRVK